MAKTINIAKRLVGSGQPAFIIVEIGQAHDGSLGMAHAFIDAVADAGADAIKFQTHIASEESTYDEKFRVKFSYQDATRYDYWRRMEFTTNQWKELADHSLDRGLIFSSTPFSLKALKVLEKICVPFWKVGSGEFRSKDIIRAMVKTKKPILYSTGMANWEEINDTVCFFEKSKSSYALLQCTSSYPTPLEKVGLNVLKEMKEKFDCVVGLSDHSGSIFPSLAAIISGASIIEIHLTFNRKMFGPDVSSSLTLDQLKILCDARNAFDLIKNNPVDKDLVALEMSSMRDLFSKSLAPAYSLSAGTIISEDMLIPKKPGGGIHPDKLSSLVGKKLVRDVENTSLLSWEDIDGGSLEK